MRYPVARVKRCLPLLMAAILVSLAGAVAVLAAEGGEAAHGVAHAAQLKDFGWRLLNFSIVVVILVWAMKKMDVKGLLAARREGIERALREAAEAKEAAERKAAEYGAKLEQATREIEGIQAVIRREAEAEKARILAEAVTTAERIREQAASAARLEVQKAVTELRVEAARLAVQLAEESLRERFGRPDQDRFVAQFIEEYHSKVEKPN